MNRDEASPHTRGWTPHELLHPGRACGFPAHAGMDPPGSTSSGCATRLPRTRGDGPRRSSPPRKPREGFPAHAGMDPYRLASPATCSRLPRTRGDGPRSPPTRRCAEPASPHTRGWTRPRPRTTPRARGFPAHAGMDPGRGSAAARGSGLPRTRGDGPVGKHGGIPDHTASPHTRGWTQKLLEAEAERLGFPAHAGMDPEVHPMDPGRRRLPRTRGDGPRPAGRCGAGCSASPHTRGWTVIDGLVKRDGLGFPAHAGMDLPATSPTTRSCRLPRTRGDGPRPWRRPP